MLRELGVTIPWQTRLVLSIHPVVFSSICAAAVLMLIIKELKCSDKSISIVVTCFVFITFAVVSSFISDAMMLPLFRIIDELGKSS